MTDIVDPGSINNGDTPDWDAVQAYFDAIYSVINSPGQLDNNNIKSAAGIAYSKLNLSNSIVAGDLTADAVTYAKIDTPNVTTAANLVKHEFGSNQISVTTETDIVSTTAPSAGFYLVSYRLHAYNEYHSGGAAPNTLTMNCKINGSTSWTEKERWNISTGATDDLRHTFSGAFPATITGTHTVKLTLTDAGSSYTEVDIGSAVLMLTRLAAS